MTDAADDALKAVLAPNRSTPKRLDLLENLSEELRGERAVLALLEAARNEKTLELRRAFFEHAASSDITRITDRAAFIDGILYFATIEDEVSLRKTALSKLGQWSAQSPNIEDILLETILNDLDIDVQQVCVEGLTECARSKPETVQRLLEFVQQSPPSLRLALIELIDRFDVTAAQSGLILLLDPAESEEIRGEALSKLAELPQLNPHTLETLRIFVENATNPALQTQAIEILRDSKRIDPELFKTVFKLFAKFPSRADLLNSIKYRLASFPHLLSELTEMFREVRSAQVRVAILQTLEDVPAVPLFVWALRDMSFQVRREAVSCCHHHQAGNAAIIEQAVLDAARVETVVSVRGDMAAVFTGRVKRDPAINCGLLAWMESETEPRVERVLAKSLLAIPISKDNDRAMLLAYRKILTDPATESELRREIIGQLANFAFKDAPELVECITLLIQRSSSIDEIETLYARLRELQPDIHAHAEMILSLFLKFSGAFPREPLQQWLADLQALAPSHPAIREQIPYLVRLTGASWISSSADADSRKSMFLPAVLEQIRRGNWIEAGRLLRESWESRTIRKSDMLLFFKKLLRMPGEESLMQSTLVMMAKGGLTTPDILDMAFAYLQEEPRNGTYTSMLAEFLQGKNQDNTPRRSIDDAPMDLEPARKADPHYRARVFGEFNQHNHSRYFRLMPEEMAKPNRPKNWNEWEYEQWLERGAESWQIARMFFALKPFDRISTMLASNVDPGVPWARTTHYTVLLHLWQNLYDGLPAPVLDDLLRGIGSLIRNTAGKRSLALLRGRAVLVFQKYWTRQINSHTGGRSVSADLAVMAAEVYLALCEISSRFSADPAGRFPAEFPELLQGLDARHLESIWPFERGTWEKLFELHFKGAEEDEKARALFEKAKAAEEDARFEEAHALYLELKAVAVNTRIYKNIRSSVEYSIQDCDLNAQTGDLEEGARVQYEYLQQLVASGKTEQAIRTLDRLLKKCWRTALIGPKRAELAALKKELQAKRSTT